MVRSLVVAPLFWGASQSSINAAQKVGGFHFIENKRLFLPGYYVLYKCNPFFTDIPLMNILKILFLDKSNTNLNH